MRKAAKVYEASESVEGMKPKMTFESHKKCTPNEFGMRVKEATDAWKYLLPIATGAAGGGAGLYTANRSMSRDMSDPTGESGWGPYQPMFNDHLFDFNSRFVGPRLRTGLVGGTLGGAALGAIPLAMDKLKATVKGKEPKKDKQEKQANTTEALKTLLGLGGAGAGVGALVGAARAPKGKRLRTMLGDAAVGGAAGAGLGIGGGAGMALGSSMPTPESGATVSPGHYLAGLGSGLGAVGAGALAHKIRNEVEEDYDNNNSPLLNAIAKQSAAKQANTLNATDRTVPLGTAGATGAGIGALIGALRAPKGKMLKYTLGGAGIGGLAGAGSAAAYNLVPAGGGPEDQMLRVPLAVAGGGLAAHLGNKLYDEVEHHIPEKKDKKEKKAFAFGQKAAFNIDWNALKHPAIAGAGLGALAGGVHGLINPGTDEKGNTRNRFGAMLRGALGGGAIGGLGGAAAGHFAPKATNDFLNKLRYQYTMRTPVPTPAQAQARQNFQSAGEEPFIENGVMNPAMQAAQG